MIHSPLVFVVLALHALSVLGSPQDGSGDTAPSLRKPPIVNGDSLVEFVSDTQIPIFVETLSISPNRNDDAREIITAQILRDNPNAVFHLGDMAAIGFYGATWHAMDDFLARARTAHVPVFPALGNHELMLFPSYGIEQVSDRFPWFQKTGYAVRVGRLAVILLNSNFGQLTDRERTFQQSWLDSTLSAMESDTTIAAVIMGCHHPPYTNSTIVSPSKEVQESFVPLYLRYAKCRLFLSGHCHALEHFRQGGKDFLVIGGGRRTAAAAPHRERTEVGGSVSGEDPEEDVPLPPMPGHRTGPRSDGKDGEAGFLRLRRCLYTLPPFFALLPLISSTSRLPGMIRRRGRSTLESGDSADRKERLPIPCRWSLQELRESHANSVY